MPFVKRLIEISVKLASNTQTNQPNTFTNTGSDTVTISAPVRCSVRVSNSGAPGGSTADIKVFGLTPDLMNQLSTLGMKYNLIPRNNILVTAGDEENGLTTVFSGTITNAYGDYNSSPEVPFQFIANSGLGDNVAPAAASSFTGTTDVATIMSGFARQMNRGFENNGVSVQLSNPYYSGNIFAQMRQCASDANINAEIVEGNKLAIWPKGGSRQTANVPTLSKDTGMIGYPAYTPEGIILRSVFNPLVAFGGLIKVQSILKPVTDVGTWAVYKLDHALESIVDHGAWESTIYAYNPKYAKPPPQRV